MVIQRMNFTQESPISVPVSLLIRRSNGRRSWIQRRQLVLWAPKKNLDLVPSGANLKRSVPIAPAITGNDGGLQPSQNEHLQKSYRGEGVPNPALRAIIKIESGGDWPWIFSRKFCGSGAKVSAP